MHARLIWWSGGCLQCCIQMFRLVVIIQLFARMLSTPACE